ncbi:MAG: hypothetical protein IM638_04705 [Bacteroidetes bacterium]|nr:hypothetical protein [Bacteroidota bacterium]
MKIRLTRQQYLTLAERIFFGAMLLLVAFPITGVTWFVTEDGASHSYNAGVLYNLLSGNDSYLGQYYKINLLPSPNWLGHLLLAYGGHWFGVAAGAKIVHLTYIAGFALAFRRLMFTVSPQPRLMSYLAFPVIYNVVFLFGFYNYCLGMVLMLVVMNSWLRFAPNPSWLRALWLAIALTLLWFSHQLTWAFTGLFIGCHLLYLFITQKQFAVVFRKVLYAAGVSLPSLVFLFVYSVKGGGGSGAEFVALSKRWTDFSDGSFWGLYFIQENTLGVCFLLLLTAMVVAGGIRYYRVRKSAAAGVSGQIIFWLIMFVLSFLLMLFIPEVIGDGGVIGIRIIWITIVFLMILAAQFRLPSRLWTAAGTVTVLLGLLHVAYFKPSLIDYNLDAHAAHDAGKYIRDKSTVVVLPFTYNWLHLHIGQYAVAGRDVVLLDNYEAQHNYFPVKWNYEKLPYNYQLASLSWRDVNCTWYWPEVKNKPAKQVDYVLIVKDQVYIKDPVCLEKIACAMDSLDYRAIYSRREITLYEYLPD